VSKRYCPNAEKANNTKDTQTYPAMDNLAELIWRQIAENYWRERKTHANNIKHLYRVISQ